MSNCMCGCIDVLVTFALPIWFVSWIEPGSFLKVLWGMLLMMFFFNCRRFQSNLLLYLCLINWFPTSIFIGDVIVAIGQWTSVIGGGEISGMPLCSLLEGVITSLLVMGRSLVHRLGRSSSSVAWIVTLSIWCNSSNITSLAFRTVWVWGTHIL